MPDISPPQADKYVSRRYVAGNTQQSSRAVTNLKLICETYLKDHYDLAVGGLYRLRGLAQEDRIVIAPTLVRHGQPRCKERSVLYRKPAISPPL